MKHRILAAMTAAITLAATAAPILPATVSAAGSYDLTVAVDVAAEHKAISPYIFGINDAGQLGNVTVNAVRQGGNRFSGYNWENNFSNAGSDWKNSSDTYLVQNYTKAEAATPGACALHLSADCEKYGVPYKMATIQMAGYVSADGNGEVTAAEAAPSARWKKVEATKNAAFSLEPDLTDDSVYMDEYVNYLVNKLGDAGTATGINGYNLDNEPALWSGTHSLMHPDKTTYKEMVDKSTAYASAIKAVDPKAEVFGLALFGVYAYYQLNDAPDKDASYDWFISYYLDQMKKAEQTAGKRLIDAIDVHYYSEAKGDSRVTESSATSDKDIAARVQAPRTLYEKGYREVSWVTDALSNYMPFLPTIQNSISTYYPGTKLAMTEYNFGGGDHVSGAIAEADALGAFAANDVYLATLWPLSSSIKYQLSAIDLYTNYDGKGGAFGDTLVSAKSSDVEKGTAYASIQGEDDSTVTVVVTNKDMTNDQNTTITLAGGADYSSATVYAITGESSDIRVIDVQNDVTGNTVNITLPALSVAQVVISKDASEAEIDQPKENTETEVTFQFSDLEKSKNGFPMIPVEDMASLKKIILNTTLTCSSGASWYGGGGGLAFNNVKCEDGTVWGFKSYGYEAGTGDCVVEMDGKFTVTDDPVENTTKVVDGESLDTFIEIQDWWKSSSNDDTGADLTITYNSVTLVYDKAVTTPTEAPTETPTEAPTDPSVPSNVKKGDVDLSGVVDIMDVIAINKALLGGLSLTDDQADAADVDFNGAPDTTDALMILKYVVKLITEFKPETTAQN